LLLTVAVRVIPRDTPPVRGTGFDLPGALLLTTGMLLAVLTVVRAPDVPAGETLAAGLAGLVALAAFVAVERRARSPLVRLGLLGCGPVRRANLGALLWAGSFVGFQFVAVLYLQGLRDWSPIETGLALLPAAIDAVLAPTVTPRIVARFGAVRTMVAGMALGAAGYALFVPIGLGSDYVVSMLPTMVLIGLGFTLVYGPLTIVATDGVDDGEQGLASGLFSTAFQFGAAIGLAVVAAVVASATDGGGDPQATLDGYRIGLLVPVAGALLALAITLPGLRARLAAS
jgi:MFS family permease